MKKLLCLMIAASMLLSACPAAFADGERKTNDSVFSESAVLSQLDTTTYDIADGGEQGIVFVIRNNSQLTIDLGVFAAFYDGDGALVYVDTDASSVVEAGYSTVLTVGSPYAYERVEYGFHAEESKGIPMRYHFTYEDTGNPDGVSLAVTNGSEYPTNNARATVLFFLGDQLVYTAEKGISDDELEIKPGATLETELKCRVPFDSYEVYLSAYTTEFKLSQYNEGASDAGEAGIGSEPAEADEADAESGLE